jgi:F0F1-type ATP synthase membrane subunit b/b'
MAVENKDPKKSPIMTKPLPQILDEIDEKTKALEDGLEELKGLIKESKQATAEARKAGQDAAASAAKTATKLMDSMRTDYDARLAAILGRLDGHDGQLYAAGQALIGPPKK